MLSICSDWAWKIGYGNDQARLIIFDCDGVLIDSEVLSCRCLSEVLAGSGIDLGVDRALDLFLGRSTAAVLQHYAGSGQLIAEKFSTELTAKVREAFLSGLCRSPA